MKNKVPKLRFKEFEGEWKINKIKEIAPLQRGYDLTNSQLKEGIYPVVYSNGVSNFHNEFKVNGPGVVTGRSGTIGKIHFIEQNYWPHNTSLWVTNFYNNYPKYIYYLYHYIGIDRFSSGSGVPTLNRNDVHDYKVAIPSLPEQEKIANFLSSVDIKIEKLEKKKELLSDYKKGMMQKLFSQKLRFKDENGNDYPKWEEKKLGEIGDIIKGKQLNKINLDENGEYPVINGGILPSGYYNNYNSLKDTITISEGGNSCGYINYIQQKFWAGGHCYTFNLKKYYNKKYIYFILKYNEDNIMSLRVGSGLPNIQKKDLIVFKIILPSLQEQKKIANFLSSIDKKIELVERELEKNREFKKGLLQQMFV